MAMQPIPFVLGETFPDVETTPASRAVHESFSAQSTNISRSEEISSQPVGGTPSSTNPMPTATARDTLNEAYGSRVHELADHQKDVSSALGVPQDDEGFSPAASSAVSNMRKSLHQSKLASQCSTLEGALREAHRHAVAETSRYWECALAMSHTKMEVHSMKLEDAKMSEMLASESQEAQSKLRQAQDMHAEARLVTDAAEAQEMDIAEMETEVAARNEQARDVAIFYQKVQKDIDEARDVTQQRRGMAYDDHHRAQETHQAARLVMQEARPFLERLPSIQAEVEMLQEQLRKEENKCDVVLEENARLRRELDDLRSQAPPSEEITKERDRLLREVRELNRLRRAEDSRVAAAV